MTAPLDGYRLIAPLRQTPSRRVWSAVRERDELPVVIKVFAVEDWAGLEARAEREFELIRRLDTPGVVRALALEPSGQDVALILEAWPGVNLAQHTRGEAMGVEAFLELAVRVAEILVEVHRRGVIHRDLKPTNILVNPDTGELALADFGISVLLEGTATRLHEPEVIEGSLPYMAPEQTGRTQRGVDHRSDLYSLGATFYELLTGRKPFPSSSALELIHAQLARRPEAPVRLRPELPSPLSGLVMKLLEKAPERRYQSASGLLHDLRAIQAMRGRARRADDERSFELGQADVPQTLRLPHQLYGHGPARSRLMSALAAAQDGIPSLVWIEGEAGVGKSRLVQELDGALLARGGLLGRGQFEPESGVPLTGFREALRAVADQLLTTSPEVLADWRERLSRELGAFAPGLLELVPRFASLFAEEGSGQPAPELEPAQALNFASLACSRTIMALARPQRPLVLVLEDLQWADSASVSLLLRVMAAARGREPEQRPALLIVLTCRREHGEDEPRAEGEAPGIAQTQRLRLRLDAAAQAYVAIALGALEPAALAAMVGDMLGKRAEAVAPLAEVVGRKTGRNAFFVQRFMLELVERGLLTRELEGWTWDLEVLEAASLPEDAVEMMAAKLARLDERGRELIGALSVFGGRFDLRAVERVMADSEGVEDTLHALAEEGLLTAVRGQGYDFGHTRLREVAYAGLREGERQRLHLAVADELLARLSPAQVDERVFEVLGHIERGLGLDAHSARESRQLPSLDLSRVASLVELEHRAARKALATGSPQAARRHAKIAVELLEFTDADTPARRIHYELLLAQAESLDGAHTQADHRMARLYATSCEPGVDVALFEAVAVARCLSLILAERSEDSIAFGMEALARLGHRIPPRPRTRHMLAALARLATLTRKGTADRWRALEPMTDPRDRAIAAILGAMIMVAYLISSELFVVLTAHQARLFLTRGRHPTMPPVVITTGLILANAFGSRTQARALAEVAARLAEEDPEGRPHIVAQTRLFLRVWDEPYAALVEPIRGTCERALEVGDLESASYYGGVAAELGFYGGVHLRTVEEIATQLDWTEQWGTAAIITGKVIRAASKSLREGPLPEPGELDIYTRESPIDEDAGGLSRVTSYIARGTTATVFVILGGWDDALALFEQFGFALLRAVPGSWYTLTVPLMWGVACAARLRGEGGPLAPRRRRRLLRTLRRLLQRLRASAAKGGNHEVGVELLTAEWAILDGHLERSLAAYGRAVELAEELRNPMLEGLALERMAVTLHAAAGERAALGARLGARDCYLRWGAGAKVEELQARWSGLSASTSAVFDLSSSLGSGSAHGSSGSGSGLGSGSSSGSGSGSGSRTASTSSTSPRQLDAQTVVQVSTALTKEVRLEAVIERVLALAIENAGAAQGTLLLRQGNELAVVAHGDADGMVQSFLDVPISLVDAGPRLPLTVLRWVERTGKGLVLEDASSDPRFIGDPYLRGARRGQEAARSVLCVPLLERATLVGLLYLENEHSAGSFGPERLELATLIAAQAAGLVNNAQLYEELRAGEVRWRSLIEQLPDAVLLVEPDGEQHFVNRLGDRELVADVEALTRGPDSELAQALHACLARGEREAFEHRSERGEQRRCYELRVAPIVVDGHVVKALVLIADISQRKRAEAERRQLEAQLRQQQRLEAIGTLAAGVAHEINNPVLGIRGYAELIADAEGADAEVRELAQEIDRETQRVTGIVRNLLTFSRREGASSAGGEAVPTTVEALIGGTLSLVRAVLRKDSVLLEIDYPEDLPKVRCRPQPIQQVIMNLVTNARDALNARYGEGAHDDKRIEIRAAAFERGGHPWLRITVADWGGGVPEGVAGRIFDPFFTTKGTEQGTGLGLAVSHGIVAEHGGELRLENEVGVGARFVVELPT